VQGAVLSNTQVTPERVFLAERESGKTSVSRYRPHGADSWSEFLLCTRELPLFTVTRAAPLVQI